MFKCHIGFDNISEEIINAIKTNAFTKWFFLMGQMVPRRYKKKKHSYDFHGKNLNSDMNAQVGKLGKAVLW